MLQKTVEVPIDCNHVKCKCVPLLQTISNCYLLPPMNFASAERVKKSINRKQDQSLTKHK